jgi:acetolactate synthase regulatory subunit
VIHSWNVRWPVFASVNMKRVPRISPSDADVCALANGLEGMRREIESLVSLQNSVADLFSQMEKMFDDDESAVSYCLSVR